MSRVRPPPAYIHGDSPPSYDEVVNKVDGLVGSNPTPEKYLEVASTLSQEELDVLSNEVETNSPVLTEEEQKTVTLGAAKEASTEETVQKLEEEANRANKAASDIEEVFISLQLKIAKIDLIHQSDFLPTLIEHRERFQDVLSRSRLLAADISQYGRSFDLVIIKFCADEKLTIERRLQKINEFIDTADGYQDAASSIEKEFKDLTSAFAVFIASFGDWAQDKEGELNAEIQRINEELIELYQTLGNLTTALLSVGGVFAVGLPVLGVGAIAAGPAAPFVIIGGLIFAGITAAAIAGLGISIGVVKGQISEKERQRAQLQEQINQIQQAREELVQLGDDKYLVFANSINTLSSYWTYTVAEAEKIKKWLEDGAKDVEFPEYMEMNLNHAVTVYASLSKYLDAYAKGISI